MDNSKYCLNKFETDHGCVIVFCIVCTGQMVGYPCRDTKNKKIIILHHQALEPSVRLLHLEFIRSLQLIMHLQSISKVKNQMSLTGDQTALMIMGNLILLTLGQNWPGQWKIQPYWQGWSQWTFLHLRRGWSAPAPGCHEIHNAQWPLFYSWRHRVFWTLFLTMICYMWLQW